MLSLNWMPKRREHTCPPHRKFHEFTSSRLKLEVSSSMNSSLFLSLTCLKKGREGGVEGERKGKGGCGGRILAEDIDIWPHTYCVHSAYFKEMVCLVVVTNTYCIFGDTRLRDRFCDESFEK